MGFILSLSFYLNIWFEIYITIPTSAHLQPLRFSCLLSLAVLVFTSRVGAKYATTSRQLCVLFPVDTGCLGTVMGRNLLELGNKLSLCHSELYALLIYVEDMIVYSQSLNSFKIISARHLNMSTTPQLEIFSRPFSNSRF